MPAPVLFRGNSCTESDRFSDEVARPPLVVDSSFMVPSSHCDCCMDVLPSGAEGSVETPPLCGSTSQVGTRAVGSATAVWVKARIARTAAGERRIFNSDCHRLLSVECCV